MLGPYSTTILMVLGTPLRRYESKKVNCVSGSYKVSKSCVFVVKWTLNLLPSVPIPHPAKLESYFLIKNTIAMEKSASIRPQEEQGPHFYLSPQECQRDDARPYTLLCGLDQLLGLPAACRHVHWTPQQCCLHPATQTQQC